MSLRRSYRALVARLALPFVFGMTALCPGTAVASDGVTGAATYQLISLSSIDDTEWQALADIASGAANVASVQSTDGTQMLQGVATELYAIDLAAAVASGAIPADQADQLLALTASGGRVFILVTSDTLEVQVVLVSPSEGTDGDPVLVIETSSDEDWFLDLLESILRILDPDWEPEEPDDPDTSPDDSDDSGDPDDDDWGDDVW